MEVVQEMSQEFKDRLKLLRKEKGLTQEELSRTIDIPDSTIRRYETEGNVPKRERLEIIADFFDVSIDYLIGRTDERKKTISEPSRVLIDSLSLSDDDIMKRVKFDVDGEPITEEEIKKFLAWVRIERATGKKDK